ncbi:MAG: YopX family protein [Lachnospiraceae bacterium]|nr:YopX family protein [Lachnospiraceae bacterium]
MREILFRAKSAGEWVHGYYTFYPHGFQTAGVPTHVMRDTNSHPGALHLVNPETIGQYTGLTDKNGRKIFEGDIVQYSKIGALGKVVWYEGDYIGFAVDDIYDSFQQYDRELFDEVEVIGNIFDNPGLLKRGESE